MSDNKVITVLGATGTQGGGVARALLADGGFAVRAVTRNAASPKARDLAELGAEVVEASLTDEGSLRAAFEGAYGAFLVTPFWEHMSPARELVEVRNLITAAKAAGPQHLVWSTLEDTREAIPAGDDRMPIIDDGYRVPHFDVKGGPADALFAESGLPVTYVLMSFYWDNLTGNLKPQRDPDGTLALHLPIGEAAIAGVSSDDIGRTVLNVLRRPQTIGATIPAATEHLTGAQMAAALSTVAGEPVAYRPPTHDQFRGFGFPGAVELGNMFHYYTDFAESYNGRRDLAVAHEINPEWTSLEKFLASNYL
jgi:uncharacterized protein YbjT (DUF2867 family)